MSTQTAAQPKAYNLHTCGVGFINRLRFVKPTGKGKGYWCTSIGALYGVENEEGRCESSLYDLRVVGSNAIIAVQMLQAAFDEGKKVFVEFKAGDTRADCFQYKQGQKQGQWGACIKGTLLQVRKAWVNGELVINQSNDDPSAAPVADAAAPESTPVSQVAEPAAVRAPAPRPHDWRERLKSFPGRIVLKKDDPESSDKLWAINATGRYRAVQAPSPDHVVFELISGQAGAA